MGLPDLDGKRAIVTASSKGLGRATAEELAAQGATVLISSRNQANLDRAKRDIVSANDRVDSDKIITEVCDLQDEDEIVDIISNGIDELGGLDILVTNHGGTERAQFNQITIDDFDDAYDLALRSTYLAIDTAISELERTSGTILNIVSASAQEPPNNHVLSNVFRLGIYGLSKSLANEYGDRGIRVNCVAPRMVYTERIQKIVQGEAEQNGMSADKALEDRVETLPLGRVGTPQEFAKVVAFLASDEASYITGTTISVDGGWSRGLF